MTIGKVDILGKGRGGVESPLSREVSDNGYYVNFLTYSNFIRL